MAETIKIRGNKQQRKMVDQLQGHAVNYRAARVNLASATAFLGASPLTAVNNLGPKRKIYDGQKKAALPGALLRTEAQPKTADQAANEAYEGAGDVYQLYLQVFRRDSLDGNGMDLISTVHHRKAYNNAFWDGTQMAYGDGDGSIFQKFTDLTVIGHELSHGVVQFSGGLVYQDQAGALNESFADVFGSLTEQYKLQQAAHEASWLVGQGVLAPAIQGDALRSMKAPGEAYDDPVLGKDPQPYHMGLYVNTSSDHGGVHVNSGIPNHAFYLLSQYLGGHAWEKAGHIWYDTMQSINNPMATFQEWAEKTVEMAMQRFGAGTIETKMTRRAWKLVGIDV
ncbi:MAG: M4 family metallopeptidase [Oceanococcus sp.]